jgi:hypothetical protein
MSDERISLVMANYNQHRMRCIFSCSGSKKRKTMNPITLIIILVVVAVLAALKFSPGFRQALRIKWGKQVSASTTAVDKLQDSYKQLVAKLPAERLSVQTVMATSTLADKDLATKQSAVEDLKAEYKQAKGLNASEGALNELSTRYEAAKQAVVEQAAISKEAHDAATEARATLDQTIAKIRQFGQSVETAEGKAELAKALRTNAEASQLAKDINDRLSQAGQASREVDKDLEEARAANTLSKGSEVDQELANLKGAAAAKSGRAELDELTK